MQKIKQKSWDKTWEKIFRSQEWGKYPPEELVRCVARNYYKAPSRSKVKILDLGCGTGAASWYAAREGFAVSCIDGSPTAIKIAKKRFAQDRLKGNFIVGDIVSLPYKDAEFDMVVDIAAVQHNTPENIKKILAEAHRVLKQGGTFFSMMIADTSGWRHIPYTTHYCTLSELKRLFGGFATVAIDSVVRTQGSGKSSIKFWLIEAVK